MYYIFQANSVMSSRVSGAVTSVLGNFVDAGPGLQFLAGMQRYLMGDFKELLIQVQLTTVVTALTTACICTVTIVFILYSIAQRYKKVVELSRRGKPYYKNPLTIDYKQAGLYTAQQLFRAIVSFLFMFFTIWPVLFIISWEIFWVTVYTVAIGALSISLLAGMVKVVLKIVFAGNAISQDPNAARGVVFITDLAVWDLYDFTMMFTSLPTAIPGQGGLDWGCICAVRPSGGGVVSGSRLHGLPCYAPNRH
jgi:hypothetical protein